MKKLGPFIFFVVCIITSFFAFYALIRIGFLPMKYLLMIGGGFLFVLLLLLILLYRKHLIWVVLGFVLGTLLLVFDVVASTYLYQTDYFLNKAFSGTTIETTTYMVVGLKDKKLTENNIEGNIGYYQDIYNRDKILDMMDENYELNFLSYPTVNELLEAVFTEEVPIVLVESTSYNIMMSFDTRVEENLEVIKTITIQEEKKAQEENRKLFHIYVVGSDFAGLNDFNMIVTINKAKKKILLTSIPRDYHIDVYGYDGVKDNITYMSALGIDTSIHSLEQFFDIKIAYYVKVNTKSLVKLVDAIGGITYCSDVEFTTSHALVMDTYNDRLGEKFHVVEGCQPLNGIQALTVARERVNIPGSDLARQDNCRKIILAIFNKMKSTDTILNYNSLLDTLADSYETTIPRSLIEEIGKKALKEGSKWAVEEQAVNGSDVKGYVHLGTVYDYTMTPNMASVEAAKKKMRTLGSE